MEGTGRRTRPRPPLSTKCLGQNSELSRNKSVIKHLKCCNFMYIHNIIQLDDCKTKQKYCKLYSKCFVLQQRRISWHNFVFLRTCLSYSSQCDRTLQFVLPPLDVRHTRHAMRQASPFHFTLKTQNRNLVFIRRCVVLP